jgi:NADPH:quinone reductase-like Zn-dependent oxidoreductase
VRAVRFGRYGPPDVLEVVEVDEPVPAAGEVRVRVAAATLNPLDWKLREGHLRFVPLFDRPPRGTGTDFAGEIVAVGGGPGSRYVGERVFGSLSAFGRAGACAEAVVVRSELVVPMPPTMRFEEAAVLPIAAGTAVQALDDVARLAPGRRVLITGGAGGVGHFAVPFAKHLGARVVATCGPSNVDFVRELGADRVIDYANEDVAACGETFDVIFDAVNALDWRHARPLLERGGLYLGTSGSTSAAIDTAVGTILAPLLGGIRAHSFRLKPGAALWQRLADLVVGSVLKPHVARRIGLGEVAEAQRDMQRGHGRGKIVVVP